MSKAKIVAIVKEKKESGTDKYNRPTYEFIEVTKIEIILSTKEIELIKDGLVYTSVKSIGLTTYKYLNDKQILTINSRNYEVETVDNSTRLSVATLKEVL